MGAEGEKGEKSVSEGDLISLGLSRVEGVRRGASMSSPRSRTCVLVDHLPGMVVDDMVSLKGEEGGVTKGVEDSGVGGEVSSPTWLESSLLSPTGMD